MLASTEVLDALKSIGLNLYERKIFVALLAKGVATAAEVSEIASVPRSRSYDILESLAEKGFVMVQPSKPIKYVALAPKEALERTKENLARKHEEVTERIDKLIVSPILEELNRIHKQSLTMISPTDMTGTLKGRHIIDRQLKSALKQASKRGVKVRILAPINDNKLSKEFAEIAEMKHLDSPLGRVFTVDGEHIMMALTDEKVHESQDVALWTSSPQAVKSLSPVFEQVWKGKK